MNTLFEPAFYQSTKKMGKYEKSLISKLTHFYEKQDYEVFPHSSLNIAWGSIYVDLDLILFKKGLVTYIEVKSKKDHFQRAYKQIENVKDFIDYAYIASDKVEIKLKNEKIGIISIQDAEICIKNKPHRITEEPNLYSVLSLKKKCIERFFSDLENTRLISKYQLAVKVHSERDLCSKENLKKIALCNQNCDECPIDTCQKIRFYL